MSAGGEAMTGSLHQEMRDAYLEAYRRYGTKCLWNMSPVDNPNTENLRIVARRLRLHGWKEEYAFARKLEGICNAIDGSAEAHP